MVDTSFEGRMWNTASWTMWSKDSVDYEIKLCFRTRTSEAYAIKQERTDIRKIISYIPKILQERWLPAMIHTNIKKYRGTLYYIDVHSSPPHSKNPKRKKEKKNCHSAKLKYVYTSKIHTQFTYSTPPKNGYLKLYVKPQFKVARI